MRPECDPLNAISSASVPHVQKGTMTSHAACCQIVTTVMISGRFKVVVLLERFEGAIILSLKKDERQDFGL